MNFAFSEEQQMLRDSVRSFLENKAPSDRVRELMETEDGFDASLWGEMAQMGWQAMAIPEEYGGAGFSWLELNIINEELGRSLLPVPFFSTVILGATVVLVGGSEDQKKAILESVAAGEQRLALAHIEPGGDWGEEGIQARATRQGDSWVLEGTKSFVVDGHTADTLIVAARSEAGVSLFLVPADSTGVSRQRLETMDMTRKQAIVELDGAMVPADAMIGPDGGGWAVLDKALQFAAVALANEEVGGAQKCMEMSVEYAKVRVQFGRPIGSFQAIKHKCADMLLAVESSKSAAYYASWAASEDNEELPVVSALAKAYCSDAYFDVAAESIQVHGGIGFTWEHDAHLYFKRAKTSQLMLGEPSYYRRRLADLIGL